MVAMSKIVLPGDPTTFDQADMFGTWRVYVQRVESKLAGSTTQVGQTTFGPSGIFTAGSLVDAGPPVVTTTLTTGTLLVNANGSVTGSLSAGTLATADRYTFIGSMRAAKDVITGVLTANLSARTTTHYGLVTMVRDVTLFDLAQPAYTLTEGNTLTVTVKRTGNLTAPATVNWEVSGGTASPADFVPPTSAALSFGANIATLTFSVKTVANTLVDGNRSANIILSAPSGPGAMLGSLTSATLNITDEDKGGTFKLSAPSYTVLETAKTASIVIQRTGGSASGVVVQFRTTDGTALAGRDYSPYSSTNGSVTFASTDISKTVLVPILDNAQVDGTRTFTFALTNVSANGVLAPTQTSAVVSITDNELGGSLQFSAATYSVLEGNTSTITVLRTGGTGGVLVDFATADGTARAGHNYTSNSGTLLFPAANTSATFQVATLPDGLIEGDNTVLLSLSNPRPTADFVGDAPKLPVLGALKNAVLTIKDAQKGLQFSSSNYSVAETTATATITVVRTGPLADTATVRYSTSDGSAAAGVNYTPAAGVLTFGPNIATQSFLVKILPDKLVTGPKTVLLLLSSGNSSVAPPAALGPRNSAVLTINNLDVAGTVKIGAPAVSVTTGAGAAVVTITRAGGAAGGVSVDYATCDASTNALCAGTAQAGIDYQSATGTVTFGPGETTKTVQVVINSDPTVKASRTFTLALSNPQGGATLGTPGQAIVTIADAVQGGVVQLGAATFSASEPLSGNASTMITVNRTGTNLADGASVILLTGSGTAAPGVNYTPLATTVVFNGNETSKTVPLTLLADNTSIGAGNMMVPVMLTGAAGGATLGTPASGVVNILRANRSFQFTAPVVSVIEGGTGTFTVRRGGPTTSAASVQWTAAAGVPDGNPGVDYKPAFGTLNFAAGAASASFTIATVTTVPTGTNRSVTVALQNPTAGYSIGPASTLIIQDRDAAGTFQFASSAYSVTEGGTVTLTVSRTGGTGGTTTTVLVPWMVSAPTTDFTPTSGTLTFTPGLTSKTFSVTAAVNTILDGNRSSTLTLGSPSAGGVVGAQGSATLTVLDRNSGGVIQFVNATQTVAENVTGGVVSLALSRVGTNLAGGILVDYTITGNTDGLAPTTSLNGSVAFAAGQTTATLTLGIKNDASAQLDRVVVVTLSNPRSINAVGGPGAPTIGANGALALTITDSLPHVQFSAPNFTVVEGQPATIGVTRTGSGTGTVTVHYATVDGGTAVSGSDYTPTSGTATVATGVVKTFTVPTFDDGLLAGSRTVVLSLDTPSGASIGTPATATLTIQDKQSAGTIQFAPASASVLEGGVVRVTVTRTGANLVGGVTVDWSATGGTASPGQDFTPTSGTLTFGANVASQSFDITTVADGIATGTKTIVLSLGAPTGGAAAGSSTAMTVYVLDQEQSVGFANPTPTVGETTASATIQVFRSGAPTGTVTVQFDTVDGTAIHDLDYKTTSALLTFGPGEIVKSVPIPIVTTNAAIRNGNRTLSLVLSSPSGASLNGNNTSTLTILDFRADLVIASVAPPSGTLTGKAVAAPSTVRNLGPVAAPGFNIGIFMVRADAPDALVAGAGSLVATQAVSGLAAGASATFPTQFTIDDGFPAGDYYVSAVANFGLTIPEADTGNDGTRSVNFFTIKNNLTKFKSASAAFSQTSPPAGPRPAFGPLADPLTCNAEGSVNLTGTFQINNQQGDSAQGQANLTGTLNDQPVQYLIAFTGSGDDSGNVTATLTNIVFNSLTPPLFTGSGSGSLAGTLINRTLVANVSGQFTGPLVGTCVFTGTLSAQAQTSFQLRTGTGRDDAGDFGFPTGSIGTAFSQTPTVQFPLFPDGGGAELRVFFDTSYPDPSTVLFTGPAGSGISSKPADAQDSDIGDDNARYRVGKEGLTKFPGGQWTVLYKGQPKTFTLPPFNANASWVVILPTANVDASGNLASLTWQYFRGDGSVFTSTPSFIAGVSVRIQLNESGDEPRSGQLSPAVTTFDLAAAGFSTPEWNKVSGVTFQYTDIAGSLYEIKYGKTFNIQLNPRLENIYFRFNPGCDVNNPSTCSSPQRLLNVFVDVPAGSVPTDGCPGSPNMPNQTGPPFFVQIQNHDTANGQPLPPGAVFASPTCLDRTGTTQFNGDGGLTDIFSLRQVITDADATYPPGLAVGAQYDITITPLSTGVPQTLQTSLETPEANPATDFIFIPNSSTPTLKPAGLTLAQAKLGQAQTISWTQPAFVVRDLFINPIVNTGINGGGVFCSVQNNNGLDPNATQATFTLPTTCQGQTVTSASVCIFYTGVNGETSDVCWFWQ